MSEDSELLRRYVHEKSEAAFAALVDRHINLVYAGALRRLNGDSHLAKDVTQRVFTVLAADASKLASRPVLAGWLHTTTRNIAVQLVRTERRRTMREQEAHTMNEPAEADPALRADWDRLRPVIDAVLDELDERDREAVILRYFEGRPLAEVGARLQLTENAARMRVDRALDRMHGLLSRRGVTSTVGALALALTGEAAVTAPTGLAATVTGAALAGTAAGAAAGLTFLTFMNTKIATAVATVIAAAAIGVAVNQKEGRDLARTELAAAQHDLAVASARLRTMEQDLAAEKIRTQQEKKDKEVLLAVVDKAQAAAEAQAKGATEPKTPLTSAAVQARFRQAQQLARSGNQAEALAEFLWCFDEGMVRVGSFSGVRLSFLTTELGKLAASYPPAQAALQERRDRAEQQMLAGASEMNAAQELAALNKALGENERNLATFDQLPVGDPRRQGLGVQVYDQLIDAGRYADAASARTYPQMVMLFDSLTTERALPAGTPNAEMMRRMMRTNAISASAKNVEVLAGAGQLENARTFAQKLLAYDNTEETRALILQHATKAGHPELLAKPPGQ